MTAARAFGISLALMLAGVALMLVWSTPRIEAGGLAPFDVRAGGDGADDARAFLAALTPAGRAVYLGPQRVFDTMFPAGLAGVMALAIRWGLEPLPRPVARAALLVPLAYLVLDLAENAAVAGLLRAGPDTLGETAVARASAFTVWKFRLVNAALGLTALALAVGAVAAARRRRA